MATQTDIARVAGSAALAADSFQTVRDRLEALRTQAGIPSIPEHLLPSFNRAYYLRNRLKCEWALHSVRILLPLETADGFADIGAGVGTFSHAVSSVFNSPGLQFELFDRSPYQIKKGTRFDLLAKGEEYLSPDKQAEFGRILISRSVGFDRIVFDGVRLPGAIEQIRQHFGRVFVIYVEANARTRRKRFEESSDGSISFDQVSSHPVELSVIPIREQNDLILDGTLPIGENFSRALRALQVGYGSLSIEG